MKTEDFKRAIDILCDYALDHSEDPESFDIHDLSNATTTFQHVFANLHYEFCKRSDFSQREAEERAGRFGRQMREMIIEATGLDLADTFGSVLDADVIES